MAKFYIIDENKEIIDSGDNMLALRMSCQEMNQRLGGNCEVISENDYKNISWNKVYAGKQLHDLSEEHQKLIDLRFVCEGCSVIVETESDLEYCVNDGGTEYQYCSDCEEMYN